MQKQRKSIPWLFFGIWLIILLTASESFATGPYEYLLPDQSEAEASSLELVSITDNSTGNNIDVHGRYTFVPNFDSSLIITYNAAISLFSPSADISFETALTNCALCNNPGWGNCRPWGIGFERPCYSRYEDGYRDFGAYSIDRNFCRLGGSSVFSANGLKITLSSERLNYGLTQEIWDESEAKHDEVAALIAQKIRAVYDPQTITLSLTPFANTYPPGETITISGNVTDTFSASPLAAALISADINGDLFNANTDAAGDFTISFTIATVGIYPVTITASSSGYPDGVREGTLTVEEEILEVTVATNETTYSPGDTVEIYGLVSKGGGSVAGATVNLNISGTTLTATSAANGQYMVYFTIPADTSQSQFNVSVTASAATGSSAPATTDFAVGQSLIVSISTDKDHYLIGDTVYCNIKVEQPPGTPVPYADLEISKTHLATGRNSRSNGLSDALGENLWTFIWGENAASPVSEGKLKIDVSATKDGYSEGLATITLAGCGDLVRSDLEDCFDCAEDCACGPNEICDPSSDFRDAPTLCSPKLAYVFVSASLSWYHKWWASDDLAGIRKKYQKLGYQVPADIHVDHINDIASYLSRPSTKAFAYAGHGEEPGGKPTLEAAEATTGNYSVKQAIGSRSPQVGGFLYRCQFESYATKWVENQSRIEEVANQRQEHPDLDYVFMFSCYSLDDDSLLNYLVKPGGTYWGYPGKLPGSASLVKRTR